MKTIRVVAAVICDSIEHKTKIFSTQPWWAGTHAEADPGNEWSSGAHP